MLPDALGGGYDPAQLVPGLEAGQVHPAQIVRAGTLALQQQPVGGEDVLLQAQQIVEGIFSPDIGNINIDHRFTSLAYVSAPIS